MGLDSSQATNFIPPNDLTRVIILSNYVNLDFSNISSINYVSVRDGTGVVKFDPSNITYIDNWQNEITFDSTKSGGRVDCKTGGNNATLKNVLNSFREVKLNAYNQSFSLNEYLNADRIISLKVSGYVGKNYEFSGLSLLAALQEIELVGCGGITISDTSNLENLTSVKIDNPVGNDILTKLPIANITTLELTNSKFTDCSPLLKAKNLVTLRLDGGMIFDRFSYMDEAGVQQSNISTLELFKNLQKQYNKLKNLYLSCCKNITDWSILENDKTVTWENWSGFNGK